jgi:hypothetical protein
MNQGDQGAETIRSAEDASALVCVHCGRNLEWCSFCDRSDCPEASCLSCLLFDLRESRPLLHEHGG